MVAYVDGEIMFFIYSLVSGAIIMAVYDFFSLLTEKEKASFLVCNIFDTLFVLSALIIIVFMLINISNGYVRSFEFLGCLIGALLYKITLSRTIKAVFSKIIAVFFAIFDFFCKMLLTPIKFMYKIIYNITGMLGRYASLLFRYFLRVLSIIKVSAKKT